MPYTFSQGEKIHYHVEGSGPPLVLQHGGFGSLHDWYDYNYVSALKEDYRLILTERVNNKQQYTNQIISI